MGTVQPAARLEDVAVAIWAAAECAAAAQAALLVQASRPIYLRGRKVVCRNGRKTLFWKDPWLSDESLAKVCPTLFCLCNQQMMTIEQAKACGVRLCFRRWLTNELRSEWHQIQRMANDFVLKSKEDVISWKFEQSLSNLYIMLCLKMSLAKTIKGFGKGKFRLKLKFLCGLWKITQY